MKFEDTLENYHRQVQASSNILGEAVLSNFLRGLTKGDKGQNMSQFSYRLENPKKNLPLLYNKWFKEAVEQPKEIFNKEGGIDNIDAFKDTFYNAFSASSNGIIILEDLLRGKTAGEKQSIDFGKEYLTIPKDKAHNSVLKFIKDEGLGGIITGYNSYEKAQAGTGATKFGAAINKGISNMVKSTASDIGRMVTTGGVNYI